MVNHPAMALLDEWLADDTDYDEVAMRLIGGESDIREEDRVGILRYVDRAPLPSEVQ